MPLRMWMGLGSLVAILVLPGIVLAVLRRRRERQIREAREQALRNPTRRTHRE